MSIENARLLVANGVTLLDEKVPGWWRVVNLDTLKMESCTQCMLGQLFGYDTEVALGAKMFGLPVGGEKAKWQEGQFHALGLSGLSWRSGDHFERDKARYQSYGYTRGLSCLEPKSPSSIGCDYEGACTHDELKCAWAEVIAERRAVEAVEAESTRRLQHRPRVFRTPPRYHPRSARRGLRRQL